MPGCCREESGAQAEERDVQRQSVTAREEHVRVEDLISGEGREKGDRSLSGSLLRGVGDLGDAAGDGIEFHQGFDAPALSLEGGEFAAGEL